MTRVTRRPASAPRSRRRVAALAFLRAGFLVSFLARGFAWRELGAAAIALSVVAFLVLHLMKPPSFSYDKFFADTRELLVWAALTGAGAWLLGLWGASFGVLLGASSSPDLRFAFEAGIARTHVRLNRGTFALLVAVGLGPAGLLFAAGVWTRAWDQVARGRAGLSGLPSLVAAMRTDALALAISVAAVVAALLLVGRWVQARAQLAHLAPGQRRKRPATLVMTAIAIVGVSVGVWALTVVLSVMSCFEADLKKKILGTNAHALLLKYSSDFSEWKAVMPKVLSVPGIAGASPFILNEVILSQGQTPTGAELKGIDPATAGSVNELPRQVIAGELSWVSNPGRIPLTAAKPHPSAQLLGDGEQYLQDTYELKFRDVDAARAEGRRLVAALGGFPYRVKDWAELNRNLFSALKLEKLAMAIILTFIVLVACFNILSTLIMLVLEKTKEISILKSMGARDSSVMKIFVLEGLAIGAIGTAIGLLLGLASCSFIERFGLQLDPDVS